MFSFYFTAVRQHTAGDDFIFEIYDIFDFSDVTSRQLMFQVGSTRYLVLGGSKNTALEDFAEKLLRDRVTRR